MVSFTSEALRGNPLDDPHVRPLHVYAPEDDSRRYPSVYVIQGMTGMADAWFNVEPWSPSFPDRISELAPDAVVVLIDAFTAVGGSQFLDSPAIGNYHTYLCDEIVPYVDAHFPTVARNAPVTAWMQESELMQLAQLDIVDGKAGTRQPLVPSSR